MLEKGVWLKSTTLLVFCNKLVNNRLVDYPDKCVLFSNFQYSLALPHQLEIFWQLYLTELLGLVIGLELLDLCTT